ncbi:MAG: four helix bundle protein [Cyclobacteriaceae bacterium]|nr:four helix bundle protein [Cyclobacteriaceae bacterium]MCH8517808.1 four helix bundle protein [Cyclobacteriaceae bacterium]
MNLNDLKIYQISLELGEEVWKIVEKWNYFEKKTVGDQFVRSTDSIAANIAEGYGRYHFKESKHFYYYARGSIYETITWLKKSHTRGLIKDAEYNKMNSDLQNLAIKLNRFINSVGKVR